MDMSEHERRLRERADSIAAALVVLGQTPERAEDAEVDLAVQHATLLAAAVAPYRDTAPEPEMVYGGPAVLALAVQTVHGHPKHRHLPVHEHLITHLGLASEYLRALFGDEGDGRVQPELLAATRDFIRALVTTAGQTAYHLRSAHMGVGDSPSPPGTEIIAYAVNADVLSLAAEAAARAAEEMRTELHRLDALDVFDGLDGFGEPDGPASPPERA